MYEDKPLFKECVEALDANVLTLDADKSMQELFEALYPITKWGKIDWEKIDQKIEVGYDPNDIIPALEHLVPVSLDPSVYILWSCGTTPIIRTNINKIVECYDDVTCVSFEKFLFNARQGYIIEILPCGKITAGVVQHK